MTELFDEQGAFFFDPGDTPGLSLAMKSAASVSDKTLGRMGSHNLAQVRDRTWSSAAARLLDIYRLTMSRRTQRVGASW
jgi:glycosyltransferase involved in cell wall biosynthesis